MQVSPFTNSKELFFFNFSGDFILQTGEEAKEDMTDYKVKLFVKSGTKSWSFHDTRAVTRYLTAHTSMAGNSKSRLSPPDLSSFSFVQWCAFVSGYLSIRQSVSLSVCL